MSPGLNCKGIGEKIKWQSTVPCGRLHEDSCVCSWSGAEALAFAAGVAGNCSCCTLCVVVVVVARVHVGMRIEVPEAERRGVCALAGIRCWWREGSCRPCSLQLQLQLYYSTFIRIGSFNEEKINVSMDGDNKEEDDVVDAFDDSNSRDVMFVYQPSIDKDIIGED